MGHDRIKEFGGSRQAHLGDGEQKASSLFEPGLDVVSAIEVRVVDQPLPADCRARFLEIDPHQNAEPVLEFLAQTAEAPRVIDRPLDIMDRARPGDDQHPRIRLTQDVLDGETAAHHRLVGPLRHRELRFDGPRGQQPDHLAHP